MLLDIRSQERNQWAGLCLTRPGPNLLRFRRPPPHHHPFNLPSLPAALPFSFPITDPDVATRTQRPRHVGPLGVENGRQGRDDGIPGAVERRQSGWLDGLARCAEDARGADVGYGVEGKGKACAGPGRGAGVGLCARGGGGGCVALDFGGGNGR